MALLKTNKNIVLFLGGGLPLPANAVTMGSPVLLQPDVKQNDINEIGDGSLGAMGSYVDDQHTTVSFGIEVYARGNDKTGLAPDTPPKISELLKACGLAETIDSTISQENVTYNPSSADVVAAQSKVYVDGHVRLVTGIRSNMKFSGSVGEIAKFNFDNQGYTAAAPTPEVNPAVTLDDNDRLVVKKITGATIGGATINMQSFDLDLGNEIGDVYAVDMAEFERTDFDPKLTVEAIKLKGNEAGWSDFIDGTIREIIITLGTAAGKTLTLTASFCKQIGQSESEDNKKMKESRSYRCERSVGDDNFFLKWS